MRTLSAPKIAALAATHRRPWRRLEVDDGDGSFNDLTHALVAGEISSSADRQVISGTFRLLRSDSEVSPKSLSPYVSDALDAGRWIRLYYTVTQPGDPAPTSGDYDLIFDGQIDYVDAASGEIEIVARDWIGTLLADRDIKWVRTIPQGTSLEDVIVQLIELGKSFADPDVPFEAEPTGVNIGEIVEVTPQKLLEAVRDVANRIGWQLRPRWSDTENGYVLAFYEPKRDNSVAPVWTFPASRWRRLDRLARSREDVLNHIQISFRDAATGRRLQVTDHDDESIERFGEHWAEVVEADESVINSAERALALLAAMISDRAFPDVDASVVVPFHPYLDIDDRVTFGASPRTHTTDQTLAIFGYTHRWGPGEEQTILDVRGKPTGGIAKWKGRRPKPPRPEDRPGLLSFAAKNDSALGETVTFVGYAESAVSEVWIYERTVTPPDPETDPFRATERPEYFLDVLIPDEAGRFEYTFTRPPTDSLKLVLARPYHFPETGERTWGAAKVGIIDPLPVAPPTWETRYLETADKGYFWVKLEEHGQRILDVHARTRIGTEPWSAPVAVLRRQGDVSVVTGEVMGPLEFEHEVLLDTYRQAFLDFLVTPEGADRFSIAAPGFDRNRKPDFIVDPFVVPGTTTIKIDGDADTISMRVERIDAGGTWAVDIDHWTAAVDVGLPDDSSNPGIGSGVGIFRITLYSDPVDSRDSSTQTEFRDVVVNVSTGSDPQWLKVGLAIPDLNSAEVTITLQADGMPAGYYAKVYERAQVGGQPWTSPALIAGLENISPLPTTETDYFHTTLYTRVVKDQSATIVSYEIRAEIYNGSDQLVATQSVTRNWWADVFGPPEV